MTALKCKYENYHYFGFGLVVNCKNPCGWVINANK